MTISRRLRLVKVVIAVNDQYFGEAIVEHVSRHKWPEDASFKLIHVIEWVPTAAEITASPALGEYTQTQHKNAMDMLKGFAEQLKKALPNSSVDFEVHEGRAPEQIISVAKTWGADHIILGSHGRKGIGLFLIGSVSTAVVTHTDCSVTIVRPKKNAS